MLHNIDDGHQKYRHLLTYIVPKGFAYPSLYILEVAIFVKKNLDLFFSIADIRIRVGTVRSQYKNIYKYYSQVDLKQPC